MQSAGDDPDRQRLANYRIYRMFSRGFVVVGLIATLAGLGALKRGELADETETWVETTGWVERARVVPHLVRDEVTYGGRERTIERARGFEADVVVRYEVGDREYATDRLERFAEQHSWRFTKVAALVRPYRAGANVPVYYDPEHPENAVLARGTSEVAATLGVLPLVFGGVLTGIAIGLVLLFDRLIRRIELTRSGGGAKKLPAGAVRDGRQAGT